MLRGIATAVTVGVVLGAVSAPPPAAPNPATNEVVLGPVSQSCQWQLMAARAALTRSANPQVVEIARQLRGTAPRIRAQVDELAARTGAALPTWPSPAQQGYTAVLEHRAGLDFDVAFVSLLHQDDARLLTMLAKARSAWLDQDLGTFADDMLAQTIRYLNLLEATGLVDGTATRAVGPRAAPVAPPADRPTPGAGQPAVVQPKLTSLHQPVNLVSGGSVARVVYGGSLVFLLALVGFGVVLHLQRRVASQAYREVGNGGAAHHHRAGSAHRPEPPRSDGEPRRHRSRGRGRGRHKAQGAGRNGNGRNGNGRNGNGRNGNGGAHESTQR
jgi:predicted outer membrane protein